MDALARPDSPEELFHAASQGRILIVDDESVVGEAVQEILQSGGFSTEFVRTGTQALERVHSGAFDCVVSDVSMPGIDGFELLRKARAISPDLEVVLMTGLSSVDTPIKALKMGVSDFVRKPLDVAELLHCVGRAVERRRLVRENREHQQNLELMVAQQAATIRHQFLGAIHSLAKAVEARDDYTRGHSDRVGNLALLIASALDLSPEELGLVRLAGLLHDIGKIGIPDSILLKPGPLNRGEWGVMKTHPVVGREIILQIDPPGALAEGILHHHERWDGSGYPAGLARDKIPVVGRILAVADAFDAMTSARPYRNAFSEEEALKKLRLARGTQLDPRVANVGLGVLAECGLIGGNRQKAAPRALTPVTAVALAG